MTIHMPDALETSIRAVVESGRFASVDDAMAEAARLLLRQVEQGTAGSAKATEPLDDTAPEEAETDNMPFWEEIEELRKTVPAEEWAKLPVDGSRQLDHYIYGSPKRPVE